MSKNCPGPNKECNEFMCGFSCDGICSSIPETDVDYTGYTFTITDVVASFFATHPKHIFVSFETLNKISKLCCQETGVRYLDNYDELFYENEKYFVKDHEGDYYGVFYSNREDRDYVCAKLNSALPIYLLLVLRRIASKVEMITVTKEI